MARDAAIQRTIKDIKNSDIRIQITGYVKDIVENDYIILKDNTEQIKVDIQAVEHSFKKNDDRINVENINIKGKI